MTRLEADAPPRAVAIAAGLGHVDLADGRLLIVDAVGRDLAGVAPTVTLNGSPQDADPSAEGLQAAEGSRISLDARIVDDVQLARVQVLLDGRIVHDAADLPEDFRLRVPTLA
ncbi:MAG: hypothetical protein AAF676_06730, partial [Pseudomonadota bacterium]